MVHTPDDIFTISSSTALGMAENLVLLLNSLVKNLPERELRKVRNALERTVHVADDLLLNITISSGFNMLTLSDGVYRSISIILLNLPPKQCPLPSVKVPLLPALCILAPWSRKTLKPIL